MLAEMQAARRSKKSLLFIFIYLKNLFHSIRLFSSHGYYILYTVVSNNAYKITTTHKMLHGFRMQSS